MNILKQVLTNDEFDIVFKKSFRPYKDLDKMIIMNFDKIKNDLNDLSLIYKG